MAMGSWSRRALPMACDWLLPSSGRGGHMRVGTGALCACGSRPAEDSKQTSSRASRFHAPCPPAAAHLLHGGRHRR
jgi:hypothetical protein